MSGLGAKSRSCSQPQYERQVPLEIHALVKDAHDQNAISGLTVENRMAGGFYLSVTGPDIAGITSEVGKRHQHLERFMQIQNAFFSACLSPNCRNGASAMASISASALPDSG